MVTDWVLAAVLAREVLAWAVLAWAVLAWAVLAWAVLAWAVLAWAGAAAASPAVSAAGTARTAASDRIRRLNLAVSTLRTLEMVLPFAPGPCGRYSRWRCP